MMWNDPKLSDSGPEAGAVSTAAQGEGAGCAWASWQAAQPVTEPVGPKPPPLIETDMTAVRCSAWLGALVFLDIDGVLFTWSKEMRLHWKPEAVAALNRLLAASGAKIVVSSSWRLSMSMERLRVELTEAGVIGEVIDHTPLPKETRDLIINGARRGSEIAAWLDSNGGRERRFVILDDDADMEPFMDRLVHTRFEDGLTDFGAFKALELLGACEAPNEKLTDAAVSDAKKHK